MQRRTYVVHNTESIFVDKGRFAIDCPGRVEECGGTGQIRKYWLLFRAIGIFGAVVKRGQTRSIDGAQEPLWRKLWVLNVTLWYSAPANIITLLINCYT